jgi:hypothetical protein
MRYRQIIAVCSEINTKHIPTLCGQNIEFVNLKRSGTYSNHWALKVQFVPRSKHNPSVIQTSQLMLYSEIIAVCSEIPTKHINTLCGQNVEFCNVKTNGA